MQIKKKPAALLLAAALVAWELVFKPIWNLNVERVAEQQQIDTTLTSGGRVMDWLVTIAAYVPSSFGLGFVAGAVVFAYWDVISGLFQRWVLRRPAPATDEPEIKAWVGNMVPYFDLKERGTADLFIYLINVGRVPFRIKSVEGSCFIIHDNGNLTRIKTDLGKPLVDKNPTVEKPLEPGYRCLLNLKLTIPSQFQRLMPDVFEWTSWPSLQFEDLNVMLATETGDATARLKLWESMRLSAGQGQIRAVETVRMFKNDEERQRFKDALEKVSRIAGR